MFQKLDRPFSPMSLVLQTLLGSYGSLVLVVLCEQITSFEVAQGPWGNVVYLALLIPGSCLFAFLVSKVVSAAGREGRWAWIAPIGLEAVVALVVALHGHLSELPLMLWPTSDPYNGENEWLFVLLTLPGWSACLYSLFMTWRLRRAKALRDTSGTERWHEVADHDAAANE